MRTFAHIGEYHELFMDRAWDALLPRLAALRPTEPRHVVEFGAGSGLGTVRMAALWPGARFTAVEPDPTMRAMLMSRLSATPGLLARVDVLPYAVAPSTIPAIAPRLPVADLVLAAHMLQVLGDDERAALHALTHRCLADDGLFLITAAQPHSDEPDDGPHHVGASHHPHPPRTVQLASQHVEERWDPDGSLAYVHRDAEGRVLRSVSVAHDHDAPRPGPDELLAEAIDAGFDDPGQRDPAMLVLRRGGRRGSSSQPPSPGALTDAHNALLAKLDPRLGPTMPPSLDGDPVTFHLRLPDGEALALWRRIETPADEPYALFVPRVQDVLAIRASSAIPASAMSDLLDRWEIARAAAPGTGTRLVRLAAADSSPVRALLDHGFAPSTSTALRLTADDTAPAAPPGVTVREPSPADRERLLDLLVEMHASDTAWGGSTSHDDPRSLLAHYVDEVLAREPGWSWVAQSEGEVTGLVSLAPPADSAWAAPATSLRPVCYLGLAAVATTARGRGVGRLLAGHALARAASSGAAGVLLDHAALSPLSATFWHRMGFRPLWTTWVARG